MNNVTTIEAINVRAEQLLKNVRGREEAAFKIKELSIDNESGLMLGQMRLEGKAFNNVLKLLGIRGEFLNYSKKMSENDWQEVSDKIKYASGDTIMYAVINDETITDVYRLNDKKEKKDDASYDQYMSWITDALGNSKLNFDLKDMHFAENTETLAVTLLNLDSEVDVFGSSVDQWKMGTQFSFNEFNFNYAPFFERLICTNGSVATEYGFGSNISQKHFNNKRIEGIIQKNILGFDDAIPELLQKAAERMRSNDISINEFYEFRKFIESKNVDDAYNSILGGYFNVVPFYKAYGVDISEKSAKWKSTASTGINAYDFFNMLTWIASHPDTIKMDAVDRQALQIKAGNFMFKKDYDLSDVAGKIQVDYPRMSIMN